MELVIHNFKCWADKSFSFNDQGITLLSGKSGVGKTSIIEAIVFVLFGTGRKIIKYGQKHCFVKLTVNIYDHIIDIKRTKGPNRLTLQRSYKSDNVQDNNLQDTQYYEDAAAQSVIYEYYGKQYQSVGYLSQSSVNSFVLMGPQEKLAFLENLIFQNTDIKIIKQKVQKLVKDRLRNQQQLVGKIEVLKSILDENEVSCDDFPIKINNKNITDEKNQKIIEKNQYVAQNNNMIKQDSVNKKLSSLYRMESEWTEFNKQIEKYKEHKNILIDRYNQAISTSKKYSTKYQDIDIDNINNIVDEITIDKTNIDKKYQDIEEQINNIKKYKKIINLKENIENKKCELSEYNDNVKLNLETEYKTLLSKSVEQNIIDEMNEENAVLKEYRQGITEYIKINKQVIDISNTIGDDNCDTIQSKILKIEQDVENLVKTKERLRLSGKKYKCPQCSVYLSINPDSNKLVCYQDTDNISIDEVNDELSRKKKRITKYKNNLEKLKENDIKHKEYIKQLESISSNFEEFDYSEEMIQDIEEQIIDIEEKLSQYKKNTDRINILKIKLSDKFFDNEVIKKLSHEITVLEKEYKSYQDTEVVHSFDNQDESYDIIENKLYQQHTEISIEKEHIKNTLNTIKSVNQDIENTNNQIKNLTETYDKNKKLSIRSISKHIHNNKEELQKLEKERQQIEENIKLIREWSINNDKYIQYSKQLQEFEKYKMQENEISDKLKSIYRLKDVIRDAESMCMKRILDSINNSVSSYLDIFFQTHPIKVTLSIHEEEDNIKTTQKIGQVHLVVDYKDMDADISILSGGELQRVVIAYNLALADLFNVPLILLDECTSNLDQELTETIVRGIRDNTVGKNILMIAHQVVSGIFDDVVIISDQIFDSNN